MTSLASPAAPVRETPRPEPGGHGPGRGLLAGLLAAGSLTAVLVAALLVGDGAPAAATPGLPDAGAVVGWGQPVVQLLTRLLAVLVVGSLLVAAVLVPGTDVMPEASRRAVRTAAAAAAAWAACEAAALLLLTGSLLGQPVTGLAPADVAAVVTALPAGRTVPGLLVLLAVLVLGSLGARTAWHARGLLLVALAVVVLPVLTSGHPAAAGDHLATVTTLAVHVVAASLWVGGLVGVLLHLRDAGIARVVAVQRLSRLALGCVVAVTGTGVLGALLLTDAPLPGLLGSGYGALLLAKTAGVALLVTAGWAHRRHALPLLLAGRPGAFMRLALVEVGLMAAVLAVAVGLSAAPPPEAAQAAAAAPATAPVTSAATAPVDAADEGPDLGPAEDMSGHDHGELSVGVLVDDGRFHVGAPVAAGTPVTVYNTGPDPVVLRADDGSFDTVVPSRTFITFPAPDEPGRHPFGDPADDRYRDVLRVLSPEG